MLVTVNKSVKYYLISDIISFDKDTLSKSMSLRKLCLETKAT